MKKCFKFIILILISLAIQVNKIQASIKVEIVKDSVNEIITTSSNNDTLIVFTDSSLTYKLATAKDDQKRRKLITAILAFPFPFGFMGAHRILLGCKPWVPVFYVATFGGCFGLIPLIDFCAIVFSKDIEQYENNPHIFMWVK